MSKHQITVIWGAHRDEETRPVAYKYNTAAELCAFIEGIEAADGWLEFEFMDSGGYCVPCRDVMAANIGEPCPSCQTKLIGAEA